MKDIVLFCALLNDDVVRSVNERDGAKCVYV